ncbi:MAG: PilZ domain-containing protein [Cellulomonas sp.]
MHELDQCVVFSGSQVLVDGYVRAFEDGVMQVESEDVLRSGADPGDEVSLLVLDEIRGECHYWAQVGRVRARGLDLVDVEMVQAVQKRRVARVRVDLPCSGTLEPQPGFTAATDASGGAEGAPSGGPLTFTVLDVSAHGIQVRSRARLTVGRRFAFVFAPTRVPLALTAEVLRVEESLTGYRYGCRFVDQHERSADELFRFVLQQQGLQRRNRLLG